MNATARSPLGDLDWDDAPIFDEGEEKSPDQKDRVFAELATLPERPPPKPTDQLIGYTQAMQILGVTRGAVQQWVKKGRLTARGREPTGKMNHLLSLEEVQAFASERQSAKLERDLPGPEREQARLEREARIGQFASPVSVPRADNTHHVELLDALRELRLSQETLAREQLQATRELAREQRETNEQLSTLNTALLVASFGAAGAALLPDHLRQEIKDKVGAVVGRIVRPEAEPTDSLLMGNVTPVRDLTEGESGMILAELQRKIAERKT